MYHYFPCGVIGVLPTAREAFSSKKVSGIPVKVFSLEIPKNPFNFPVK